LPDPGFGCDSYKDSVFFMDLEGSEAGKGVIGFILTPIFIIDVHALKDEQILKMPTHVSLAHQERSIGLYLLV
jgi:hypothetical protein